jgi:hypothetical protein
MLIGMAAISGCQGSKLEDVDAYRAELASITDRGALKQQILANADQMVGDREADAALWARLDLVQERVDKLDGLIHVSELADGTKLKFYEREHGSVSIAWHGATPTADASMMDGEALSAIEVFQRAEPGKAIPQALIDAEAHAAANPPPMLSAAENAEQESQFGLPAEDPSQVKGGGTITQHHEIRDHGTIQPAGWYNHCNAGNYPDCVPNGVNSVTHLYNQTAPIVTWLYMLNSRTGPGLGELMVVSWDVYDESFGFPANFGPWFSGIGEMVKWRTTGRQYSFDNCTWPSSCPHTTNYAAQHIIDITVAPDNHWNLAAKGSQSPFAAVTPGNFALP